MISYLDTTWRYVGSFLVVGPLLLEVLAILAVFVIFTRVVWRQSSTFARGTHDHLKYVLKWIWVNALSWVGFITSLIIIAVLANRGPSPHWAPPLEPFLLICFVVFDFGIALSIIKFSVRGHSLPDLWRSVFRGVYLPGADAGEPFPSASLPPSPRQEPAPEEGASSVVGTTETSTSSR